MRYPSHSQKRKTNKIHWSAKYVFILKINFYSILRPRSQNFSSALRQTLQYFSSKVYRQNSTIYRTVFRENPI